MFCKKNYAARRVLAALTLLLVAALPSRAYDYMIDGICYNKLDGNNLEVTYKSLNSADSRYQYAGDIIIPEKVEIDNVEYSVTAIGDYAFSPGYNITSIALPNSITLIGGGAFMLCSIEQIELPDKLTTIGYGAFEGCFNIKSVVIPASVTNIVYGNPFVGCTKLETIIVESGNTVYDSRDNCNAIIYTKDNALYTGCRNTVIPSTVKHIAWGAFKDLRMDEITVPEGVQYIGAYAFMNNTLKSIKLPNTLLGIGEYSFDGSGIESIYIPASVVTVVNNPFENCANLESIVVDPENQYYDSRDNCNAFIDTRLNALTAGCKNTVIPNTIEWIGPKAFNGCIGLNSLKIPASVKWIMGNSFVECWALESITVDPGNQYYDSRDNCNALIHTESNTLIVGCDNSIIPKTVTAIGPKAFYQRLELRVADLHEGITEIGDSAFVGTWLYEIKLPNSLKTLGKYAFYRCGFGRGVVTKSFQIGNSLEKISAHAFQWCMMQSVSLPESVKEIDENAFYGCRQLESLDLGAVERIGSYAFLNCDKLQSLIIPNTVRMIEDGVFYISYADAKPPRTVTIGSGVKSIGSSFFNGKKECPELIVSLSTEPPVIDEYTFHDFTKENTTLYVPEESKTKYESAEWWRDFSNIVALPAEATDVKPDVSELQLAVGDDHTLSVKVEPAEAIQTVAFSSDSPEVATVDGDGLITAVSDGEATISTYAIDGSGIVAQCKVKVGNAGVENVTTDATATEVARYDLYGRRLTEPTVGINIVVMSDGSARKELVK